LAGWAFVAWVFVACVFVACVFVGVFAAWAFAGVFVTWALAGVFEGAAWPLVWVACALVGADCFFGCTFDCAFTGWVLD
jgi:hypothetical protein